MALKGDRRRRWAGRACWAVPLRKLADRVGLTGALGPTLARAGKFPWWTGVALVSMAVAIALGATSMNDIAVLAHDAGTVLGAAPSDTTVRRTLELADDKTLDRIARARAGLARTSGR